MRILPKQPEKRNKVIGVFVGALMALIFGLCYNDAANGNKFTAGLHKQLLRFEYKVLDFRFVIRGPLGKESINKDIVLLDYDDETEEWAPFPPDRMYYSEIITALADENSRTKATFFDIFFFDPTGQKLDEDMAAVFYQEFLALTENLDRDAEVTASIKEKMYEAYEQLSNGVSQEEAAKIGKMLKEIASDKPINEIISNLEKTAEFVDSIADLADLAPDRDTVLQSSIMRAGNVYLAQTANNAEKTDISTEDIIFNPKIHEIFAKLIVMSDRTKTANDTEVDVNRALRNLQPEEYKMILDYSKMDEVDGKKPLLFTTDERLAMATESAKKQSEIEKAMDMNLPYAFEIPKEGPLTTENISKYYRSLIEMEASERELTDGVAGIGYVKPEFQEDDGTIRTAAPASYFQGKLFPHIDLMLAMVYMGVTKDDITFYKDKIELRNCKLPWNNEKTTITIPLIKRGTMLVNWSGTFYHPGHFDHRSFRVTYENARRYNVIRMAERDEKLNPAQQKLYDSISPEEKEKVIEYIEFFKGKITMTGLTAEGTHDLNPIPFHPRYPLVGMHANLVNTITKNIFMKEAPYAVFLFVMLILGVILGYIGGSAKQLPGAIATFSTILGMFIISQLLFGFTNIWFPFIPVLVALLLIYLVVILYRFMTEGQEAIRMKKMFSSYVNEEVVEALIQNPDMLKLGGERMDASTIFCLAGGPGLDTEDAEELVDRLNEFFDAMTEQIFKYKGTLDKYEGRIIMAIYGAPMPYEDHPTKICLSCVDMRKAFEVLKKKWKEEGKEPLTITAGVNSGPMIAGNMGSASRFNYTVMGDTVNVSARILGASIQYGVSFMISESTYDRAKEDVIARLIDKIIVVGKEEAVRVYEIIAAKNDVLPPEQQKFLDAYRDGFELYTERKWDEAMAKFEEAISVTPDDKPSKMLLARCKSYKENPPKEGWAGEFVLTSKGL